MVLCEIHTDRLDLVAVNPCDRSGPDGRRGVDVQGEEIGKNFQEQSPCRWFDAANSSFRISWKWVTNISFTGIVVALPYERGTSTMPHRGAGITITKAESHSGSGAARDNTYLDCETAPQLRDGAARVRLRITVGRRQDLRPGEGPVARDGAPHRPR
jgi:hypothetical protein